MPGYKTHLFGGAVTFASLYYVVSCQLPIPILPLQALILLGATLLGSLIPDLDINSKIQRLFYFCIVGAFIGFLLTSQWVALMITSVMAIVIGLLRHRTILHNPLFLMLLPLPIIYCMSKNHYSLSMALLPSLFFIAGCWSHIILDFGIKKAFTKH